MITAYLGIDPGRHGAAALLVGDVARVYHLPHVAGVLCVRSLWATLEDALGEAEPGPAWVEDQMSVVTRGRRQAPRSIETIFLGLGALCATASLLGFRVRRLPTVTWRRLAGLPATVSGATEQDRRAITKARSVALARTLYPALDVRHDGLAEALILAHLARLDEERRP